jgi:fatty-acyl-CoA synthase
MMCFVFRFSTSCVVRQKEILSYFHGPSDTPLLGVTIGQALERRVDIHPDKEAVVFCTDDVRKTFYQLLDEVDFTCNSYIYRLYH